MKDFIIENARPEDAAAILEYLKIVGGETDNLNMGAEGIPIAVEVEEAFLRSMLDSSDDVMYAASIVLVLLVQFFQMGGTWLSHAIDHRRRK